MPEVCVEIVSNSEGDELTLSRRSQQKGKAISKKDRYAQIRIPYYAVFDPLRQIQGEREMNGALLRVWSNSVGRYTELTPAVGISEIGQRVWLEEVGLGLTLWSEPFEEEMTRLWLRWCDREGNVIPTGAERAETERQGAETERQQAEIERQRAERLAEPLRAIGVNPDEI